MAPALTEAGQSQKFKLPPSSHSLPASPVGVTLSGLNNISQLLTNGHSLRKDGHIGLVTKFTGKKKLEGQVNFIANDLIKEIQTEPGTFPFNNLTTLAIASARRSGGLQSAGSKLGATESVAVKEGRFMMSNCDPSMGDQEDNMGLQKSNSAVPSLESGNFLKEKILSSDMDQLFKNLGAAISISDLGGSVDLGQNVEELLQVIKSMESNPTEPDVPLHGESVGMDPSEGGEPEGMFAISDGTDIGSGLSTFERLLNDVDMMNMCVDVNLAENPLVTENKEALTKERIEEARKKQFEMERKCEWLLRRLRKLQARTMGKHVSEEVTGLLENAHRMLKQSASQKETSSIGLSSGAVGVCVQSEETSAAKSEISRKEKKVKGISTFAMANLFRRLDMLSQQQAAVSTRNHSSQRYFGSSSGDHASSSSSSNGPRVLPKFSAEDKNELEKVSGQLHIQLKMVESFVDSDATASSSGGESCDEMQPFNNQHQMHVSM